jgi:hypothetical protein
MSRTTRTALAAACALIALAAPAQAATVGVIDRANDNVVGSSPGGTFYETGTQAPTYAAPVSGIITSVSMHYLASEATVVRFKTLRGGKVHTTTQLDAPVQTIPVDAAAIQQLKRTWPMRLPVSAGDVIAAGLPSAKLVMEQSAGSQVAYATKDNAPPEAPLENGNYVDLRMLLGAVIEPDADNDGYGDQTQDACPAVAARQATPCSVDLAASVAFVPASVVAGEAALLQVDVTSPGYAQDASVSVDLPPGLEVLAKGDCTGTDPLTCPVSVGPGQTRRVALLVRAAAAGEYAVSARTLAPGDANPLNDVSAASLKVVARAASAPAMCTVPKLKGLTRAKAKAKLVAAGCALGRVTGAKGGKVATQTIPAKTRVASATKVGVRLSKGRRR